MRRRPTLTTVVSVVVVAGAALFILLQLQPGLLVARTTPAGGDMGAHVWGPAYIRDHLLPHGRISGWTPDWYAGFPAYHFYFPLPFLLVVLLDVALPYGVAFKLVTVLGLVGLPVAAWLFGRLLRLPFPTPEMLAAVTIPFVFDQFHTIWGGNAAATLAGEFSFSIGMAVALVFIGVFFRALETGRGRGLGAALLGVTALCHLLTAAFAVAGALAVLAVRRPGWKRLRNGALIGVLGGGLVGFWFLPFLARLPYSNDMGWERTNAYLDNLLPFLRHDTAAAGYVGHWKVLLPMAVIGVIAGLARRRRGVAVIGLLATFMALGFRFVPAGPIWNARLLPFWYLSVYFLAAVAVAEATILLGTAVRGRSRADEWAFDDLDRFDDVERLEGDGHDVDRLEAKGDEWQERPAGAESAGGTDRAGMLSAHAVDGPGGALASASPENDAPVPALPLAESILAVGALLIAVVFAGIPLGVFSGSLSLPGGASLPFPRITASKTSFVPSWARWNYSGYERKAAYPEYRDVVTTMADVGKADGCGRAMWEYESELNRFGTPMALMLLPHWTDGCIGSMEGLYFESSATVPYHFLNQSELSKAGSRAMRDLPYQNLDVDAGVRHLQLLGVRYYMAVSPEAQLQAQADPDLRLVATTKPHAVDYPDGTKQRTWQVFEVRDSPLVAPLTYDPVVVRHGMAGKTAWLHGSVAWYTNPGAWDVPLATDGPASWPRIGTRQEIAPPEPAGRPVTVSHITTRDDRISFRVDHPGTPVLVKVSYFPNWKVSGAKGPWRVTPNLMVVVPTSTHVSLHYGWTGVDRLGWLVSLLALIGLVGISLPRRSRPGGAIAGAAGDAPVEADGAAAGDGSLVVTGARDPGP